MCVTLVMDTLALCVRDTGDGHPVLCVCDTGDGYPCVVCVCVCVTLVMDTLVLCVLCA